MFEIHGREGKQYTSRDDMADWSGSRLRPHQIREIDVHTFEAHFNIPHRYKILKGRTLLSE